MSSEPTALLSFKGVSRYFTVKHGFLGDARRLQAVDRLDLHLQQGESLGLVGESGCGKSTLGRMACGLLPPSAGEILLAGRPLPAAGARSWAAGRVQMIFQDPFSSLNPRLRVGLSVAEPLMALRREQGLNRADALAAAHAMLARVGLAGMGQRYPHEFSGGQRQRIAVARALMTRPDVVVCDEPVSALDASVQAQILNLLREVQEEFCPAYLFISHDLAVVGFMCPRIAVMYLGQIVEEGSREELFQAAAHPYTQALLASMPAKGQRLPQALEGELPSPLHLPQGCYFHPRCPRAQAQCRHEAPQWRELAAGWRVRCHYPVQAGVGRA